MSKFFPKLSQTHVWIQTDGKGNGFNCPMLPVSSLAEMDECSKLMGKVDSLDSLNEAKRRMIALIRTVLPSPYAENLDRFDIPSLAELVSYLMYGDADDQKPESPKN